jgi:hypothetical protein
MKEPYVVLTKTDWHEPSRLRHQLAHMLAQRGHEVTFVEKPGLPGTRRRHLSSGIRIVRHGELLHHQLRLTSLLERLNAAFVSRELHAIGAVRPDAVVVNFCYDYDFLRECFPENVVITVLNDDFVAGAKPFMRRQAESVLRRTVRASDHTLVVSYPLLTQARAFSCSVSTFFPWARTSYRTPQMTAARPDLLYWGFLNDRISWPILRSLMDSGIAIHFAGPIDESSGARSLLRHKNASYHGIASLDELSAVVDRCAATILPYDLGARYGRMVAAITINNRAFELLASGLPLLYSDLPGLLSAPATVIARCRDVEDFQAAFERARKHFSDVQADIARFLEFHGESARYQQLMSLVADVGKTRGISFDASA